MSSLADAVDSFYAYIRGRMTFMNATVHLNGQDVAQPFGGIVDAQDWPQAPVVEGGLYLLILGPTPGGMGTPGQNEYTFHLQWNWEIIGSDLTASEVGQNRGDRYRTNLQIMENLRLAHYPGFAQKMTVVTDTNGVRSLVGASSEVPVNAYESIRWTLPRFAPRGDTMRSGVLYGAAAVELTAYADITPQLA